jgi:hypothetical protein
VHSQDGDEAGQQPQARPTNRRMRRQAARLQAARLGALPAAPQPSAAGEAGGAEPMARLETHTWHARRMRMERRWARWLCSAAARPSLCAPPALLRDRQAQGVPRCSTDGNQRASRLAGCA